MTGFGVAVALIAAIGGLGGVAALLRTKAQNRLTNVQADALEVTTMRELVRDLRNEMNTKVDELKAEIEDLRGQLREAHRLEKSLRARIEELEQTTNGHS